MEPRVKLLLLLLPPPSSSPPLPPSPSLSPPSLAGSRHMPKPLADQVVVVTGASQGIGRATALELARRGAKVVVAARNDEALHAVVAEIEAAGGRAKSVVADVADFAQVKRVGRRAIKRFGSIDTWVNNAAVAAYATVGSCRPTSSIASSA